MMRIGLFLGTNIAILIVLSIVMSVFGVDRYLVEQGLGNMGGLLLFSAIFGMGGAFISLLLSKWMAKRSMGLQILTEPQDDTQRWLVETVRRQADNAGIGMPEVGVYNGPEMNAFATGANKNSALVAVSTGLLQTMDKGEVEAVLGHEISHVANGDMVTLTLIQGVLNTFVIFFSRIIGMIVDKAVFKSRSGRGIGYFITYLFAQIVLGILASMVVMWFSRWREFRADNGGAKLAGRKNMIDALKRLQSGANPPELPGELAAFGISGGLKSGFRKLMMSHPPLEKRIHALEQGGQV